jgi:hypothetical protein
MAVLFGGVIFPSIGAFISWLVKPRLHAARQKPDSGADPSDSEAHSPESAPPP